MFHQTIVLLQRARKYIDKQAVELNDSYFLSNNLSDISYSITIAIKDLARIDKILKEKEPKGENNE